MKWLKIKRASILVLVVSVIYFSITLMNQQKVMDDRNKEIEKILTQIEQENQNRIMLEKRKESVREDEYIEDVAREKLGLVRQGERLFIDIGRWQKDDKIFV